MMELLPYKIIAVIHITLSFMVGGMLYSGYDFIRMQENEAAVARIYQSLGPEALTYVEVGHDI